MVMDQIKPMAVFVNKMLWMRATFIYIVCVCFPTTMAEMSSANRAVWPAKPQVFTSMTFTRNVSEPDGEHLRMQMKLRGLLTGCHPQGMEAASFLVIMAP